MPGSMQFSFSQQQAADLEAVISSPRFATYLREARSDRVKALKLYCWNAEVSSAFYIMLQFCEIAVRNAAVEAVEAEFGANWHLSRGFRYTLPVFRNGRGYQPGADLAECAARLPTAGKVVAELKLAFWQYLFVKGQDKRLWEPHFDRVFPGRDTSLTIGKARHTVHQDVEKVRYFRNRVAHHEPIFARKLDEDQARIDKLIHWRRPSTADWLTGVERVSELLAARP